MNKSTILNILSICVLLLSLSAPLVAACADDECESRGLGHAVAKFDWSGDRYTREFIESPYRITVAGNESTARWTASPAVTGVVVKMGQDYEKYSGGTSGTVRKDDHDISHITFCGRETTTTRATTTTTTTEPTTTTTRCTTTTTEPTTTTTTTKPTTTTTSSTTTTTEPTTTTTTSTSTTTTTKCTTTTTEPTTTTTRPTTTTTSSTTTTTEPTTTTSSTTSSTTTSSTTSSTTTSSTTSSTTTSTSSTTTTEPTSTTTSTTTRSTTTTTRGDYEGCCGHSEPPNQAKPKTSPSGGSSGGSGGSVSSTKPTCFDGIKNQNETGVDCGGSCQACVSCSDGVLNQGETGVDCGGPCKACKVATTTTTRPKTTSAGSLISSSLNKSSNLTKPAGDGITTTTLFTAPAATGDVIGNVENLGRSLLLPLLALLIAYFVLKKRRKATDEEIVPQ